MKPYQKTAKDLAWDRERSRLQSEIGKINRRLFLTMDELKEANAQIEAQKKRIEELTADLEKARSLLDLPREDLNLLLTEALKRKEAEHILKGLLRAGNFYCGGMEDIFSEC